MGWKRRPLWLRHSRVNLDIHDSTIVEPRAEKADPPSASPTSMDLENHLAQLRFNLDDADIRDNTNIELQLENKASPSAKICTLPEELRQEIISYLNYVDAWSLKQTSKLFLQVVEIPTIASFLAHPYGPSLAMLENWAIIPIGYEACNYCHRLRSHDNFSRFQRCLTSARQKPTHFDYKSWKPENHFCIECGVQHGRYKPGQHIYTGFGDPGYQNDALIPCPFCPSLAEPDQKGCRICSQRAKEDGILSGFFYETYCDHQFIRNACRRLGRFDLLAEHQVGRFSRYGVSGRDEGSEPHWKKYQNAEPRDLLTLVGEGLVGGGW